MHMQRVRPLPHFLCTQGAADRERKALEEFVALSAASAAALPDGIQPWDWRHYAEKV